MKMTIMVPLSPVPSGLTNTPNVPQWRSHDLYLKTYSQNLYEEDAFETSCMLHTLSFAVSLTIAQGYTL